MAFLLLRVAGMPEAKEAKPDVDSKDAASRTDAVKTEAKKEPEGGSVGTPRVEAVATAAGGGGGDASEHWCFGQACVVRVWTDMA